MKSFVEKVTAKRQECADRGDSAMSACYKLVINSSYGRLGMNLSKRLTRKFVHAKNLEKELLKNKFISCQQISDGNEIYEVCLKKTRQTDSIPVQCCKCFLKIHFLYLLKTENFLFNIFKLFKFSALQSFWWSSLSKTYEIT